MHTPSFKKKKLEGTTDYGFDRKNNFTLLATTPKKIKRVVFLSTMHFTKNKDSTTQKEDINGYDNMTKGVDSHDQKCSIFTTARKPRRWPMRFFYGILDSSLVNAYAILTMK